jgi:hypothetical protein
MRQWQHPSIESELVAAQPQLQSEKVSEVRLRLSMGMGMGMAYLMSRFVPIIPLGWSSMRLRHT